MGGRSFYLDVEHFLSEDRRNGARHPSRCRSKRDTKKHKYRRSAVEPNRTRNLQVLAPKQNPGSIRSSDTKEDCMWTPPGFCRFWSFSLKIFDTRIRRFPEASAASSEKIRTDFQKENV